jgi:hypothetical protein
MTKDEFIDRYSSRSGHTRAEFEKYSIALPCQCGEAGCQGWGAFSRDAKFISTYLELYAPEGWNPTDDIPADLLAEAMAIFTPPSPADSPCSRPASPPDSR